MKLTLLCIFPSFVTAFVPNAQRRQERLASPTTTELFATNDNHNDNPNAWITTAASFAAAACLGWTAAISPAVAVSGGGLDFANLDITASPNFANANFKGKDFTQGESRLQ